MNKRIYKILVTGAIGAGKSSACRIFQELGVSVFYSDKQAALMMNQNEDLVQEIKNAFGDDIYEDGVLNRKSLAEMVFNNKDRMNILNSLVHPVVSNYFDKWCDSEEFMFSFGTNPDEEKVHYIIEESAIAIELGIKDKFDYIVVVTADEETRINRVMNRDKCDRAAVISRIVNQMPEEEKCGHADFLITNNDFPNLECQVKSVHKKIIEEIKSSWLEL